MNIQKTFAAAIVSSFLLGLSPAVADDAADSNRLFITAVKALNDAEALTGNGLSVAETRFLLLNDVASRLHRIIDDYSGTDLAVKLMIGEDIGPVSMVRIQQAQDEARTQLAIALADCGDPASCLRNLALRESRSIEESGVRARLLARIAINQTSSGLLAEALQAIDETEGPDKVKPRSRYQRSFAHAQAREGEFANAKNTIREIGDRETRGYAYIDLVRVLAEAGQFTAALEIARSPIDAIYDRPSMFRVIAVAQSKAGQQAEAYLTVGSIETSWWRAIALEDIAEAQAEARLFDEAIETINMVEFAGPRVRAIVALAVSQEGDSYFSMALKIARGIEDERDRGWAHQSISRAQAELGFFADAAETLSGVAWEGGRDGGFERIAVEQAKVGRFSEALETVEMINFPSMFDGALTQIAASQAEAGQFSDALETIQKMKEFSSISDALAKIAGAYAEVGRFPEALEIASRISDPRFHGQALERIVVAYAKAGQFTQAVRMAREAMDEGSQGRALGQIAFSQAESGMLTEAIDTALEQPDASFRVNSLLKISDILSE